MATQRGQLAVWCGNCGRSFPGGTTAHWCDSSPEPSDPIAAAEQRGFERGRQWAIDALRDGEPYEEWRIAGGRTPYSPMSAAHFASYLEALATQPTDTTET